MNEILPFTATRIDLEIIILQPDREKQISYGITYMWNLKFDKNKSIYKIERDSQTQKANLWLPKCKEKKGINQEYIINQVQTTTHDLDKPQGFIVTIFNILY